MARTRETQGRTHPVWGPGTNCQPVTYHRATPNQGPSPPPSIEKMCSNHTQQLPTREHHIGVASHTHRPADTTEAVACTRLTGSAPHTPGPAGQTPRQRATTLPLLRHSNFTQPTPRGAGAPHHRDPTRGFAFACVEHSTVAEGAAALLMVRGLLQSCQRNNQSGSSPSATMPNES